MSKKTFTTYQPTEQVEFDINDQTFHCVPMLPGATLLDFMSAADPDHPNEMAKAVRTLLKQAVVEEEREAFEAFITDPANAVSVDILSEIAGYVADKLSGVDPSRRQATPSLPG